ncbi:hypothetical protein H1P_360022 [Hyella patelloides LEGE 07179]|uniref:Uncharacterized protein n=1 Tax=Hyella patelloides LEGE 07179 TaxID=945734 RepID=A0A563VWC1_9CYAN|nr:hypothetical protein H1P_360022 [Hyella patelloides LEGE 07179]
MLLSQLLPRKTLGWTFYKNKLTIHINNLILLAISDLLLATCYLLLRRDSESFRAT